MDTYKFLLHTMCIGTWYTIEVASRYSGGWVGVLEIDTWKTGSIHGEKIKFILSTK